MFTRPETPEQRPSRTPRLWALLAALFSLALIAAACGNDDDVDTGSEDTPAADEDMAEEDEMADEDMAEEDEMADEDMAEEDEMADEDMAEEDEMAEGRPELTVSFDGLEPLGAEFEYEVWTIVDGAPVSGGIFDIADDGSVEIAGQDRFYGHDGAAAVVITIEPAVDDDPAPAATHVLAGDIAEDGSFELSIGHTAALGTDFADAAGSFILGTPTNDPDADELSGVWFLSVPGPEASLVLPTLPAGWAYEGWAVIDGQPVSTGRFLAATGADDFDAFSGANDGPPFPGEDFIVNAPEGLSFPTDLTAATIVISVEPDTDNSPAPFALKPLVAEVPDGLGDHENTDLGAGPVAISGSGSIG